MDLQISAGQGLCWEYGKANLEPILPRSHSKTFTAAVARFRITNAMNRSCIHYLASSVKWQYKIQSGA